MSSIATSRRAQGRSLQRERAGAAEPSSIAALAESRTLRVCGRLSGSPQLRRMPSGRPALTFTVALEHGSPGAEQGALEQADRVTVLACGELAETCGPVLARGRHVCVEGSLRTRNWEDPEGRTCSRRELVARSVASAGCPLVGVGAGGRLPFAEQGWPGAIRCKEI
jgi:hypothetical protein